MNMTLLIIVGIFLAKGVAAPLTKQQNGGMIKENDEYRRMMKKWCEDGHDNKTYPRELDEWWKKKIRIEDF
ncbi:hypothetical protein ABER98_20140 [Domibacillus aminovorans]